MLMDRTRALAGALAATFMLAATTASPADTSTHERLTALAEEFLKIEARLDPVLATSLGLPGHDGELPIPSEAERAATIKRVQSFKQRVATIAKMPETRQSLVDSDDAKLLQAEFDGILDNLLIRQSDRKSYARPALRVTGAIFTQFLHLPVIGREGATQADLDQAWADIASRLSKGPAYIEAAQKLVTKPGRLAGIVGGRQLAGSAQFFNGALLGAAKTQLAHDPAALARVTDATSAVVATIATTRAYIDAHAPSWPENYAIGKAAYNQMLRAEQLLPFNADDLERMGRDELAHGWAEEAWLIAQAKDRKQTFGPTTGGGMAPDGPPLVDYYRDRLAELKQFVVDHDIVTVPDWLGSMEIVETPPFLQPVSPGASMNSPRLFAKSTTGYYFITPPKSLEQAAATLDMNEDFDRDRIWSTGAHEAMPGHFFQLSIAHRHPDFIRKTAGSSAFAEGWAFYGEEMFVRLGMYGDDLDARLFTARWERVRGARAIVDVKLATGEWTVDQAGAFFEEQSGFTKQASRAAVSGIALGPGYVIAYTVGRFQLETLLAEYLVKAGDHASLHDFHDRLLSYGSVPFAICGPELLKDLDKPASAVRAAANY
jgi:uncharacterized protein (DUF885 family)